MRLNKKKLAALAMSAMMAASTMSVPVYAEELTSGDAVMSEELAAPEVSTPEVDAVGADESGSGYEVVSVKFSYTDGKATATYVARPIGSTTDEAPKTVDAQVVEGSLKEPTCANGYVQLKVELYGKEYFSGVEGAADAIVLPGTGEHDYEVIDTEVIEAATHMQAGKANIVKKCKVCGDKVREENAVLDQQAHTWSTEVEYVAVTNILVDKENKIVLGEDGKPQAEDDSKDATYKVVYKCTEYGKNDVHGTKDDGTKEETVTIPAKTGAYAVIVDTEGLTTTKAELEALAKANADGKITNPTVTLPIDEDKIELKDCSEGGSYTVEYYTAAGVFKSTLTFEVDPHHYNETKVAVFKTKEDMEQCTVKTEKDGSLTVTSDSCYMSVAYEEVTLCRTSGKCSEKTFKADYFTPNYAGKELSRVTKTAEPTGKHVIKQTAKNQIDELIANAKAAKKTVAYDDLKAVVKANKDYVTISDSPACGKEGEVTISYICMVDRKTVVETQTVTALAADHQWAKAVMDKTTYVAPTCTTLGSYDAVVKCSVCGQEKERITVKIPRLKHTNELSVTESGVGTEDKADTLNAKNISFVFEGNTVVGTYAVDYTTVNQIGMSFYDLADLDVSVDVVSTCENCDHTVVLAKDVAIKVVDVQKEDASGHAGRITLKVSYTNKQDGKDKEYTDTKTFAYFSTLAAYLGRVDSEPEEVDGLRIDKDGVCRYYKDGEFVSDFNGIASYNGGQFFVANGVVASEADGLNEFGGKWYYLSAGQIQKTYTGLASYDNEWFYIINGRLDTTVNGLVPYNGGTFLFAEGRLCNTVNGLWQNFDGSWYYLALGQVQTQHTGVVEYDGAFFYVRNGKLATDFNGTVEYDGATFKVNAGQLGKKVA